MRCILFSFSIALLSLTCKSKCDCYDQNLSRELKNSNFRPWKVVSIPIDSIASVLSPNTYDEQFGLHLENSSVFRFMSGGNLYAYDLRHDSLLSSTRLQSKLPAAKYYVVHLNADSLHFINTEAGRYMLFRIQDTSLKLQKIIEIGQDPAFKNFRMYPRMTSSRLPFQYPYLLAWYGANTGRNFKGDKPLIRIDIEQKTWGFVGAYPSCYTCSRIYDIDLNAVFSGDSIISIFNKSDDIQIESGSQYSSVTLQHNCQFTPFDESQEMDLSYVRRTLENEEQNCGIFKVKDSFVIFKQLKKESLRVKAKYQLFVMDKNLHQVYQEILDIIPHRQGIFQYKDGLAIFNDSLTKTYYFDFSK